MVCFSLRSLFFTSSLKSIVGQSGLLVNGVPSIFRYVLMNVRIKLALSPYVPLVQYQFASFNTFRVRSEIAESITSLATGASFVNIVRYDFPGPPVEEIVYPPSSITFFAADSALASQADAVP